MTVVEGPRSAGLIARVQGILMKPAAEWDVIEAEPATIQGLFTGYVGILAAIPLVVGILVALGASVIFHGAIMVGIVVAIVVYILELVSVFIVGFIADALAPSFDGQRSLIQAMKVAAYSFTAVWIAGIISFVPVIGWLIVIAAVIYALYTMYLGLPKLMKVGQEKAMGYFLVVLVISIIIRAIMMWVVFAMTAMMAFGAIATGAAVYSQSAYHNGNLARLEAASRQMAAAGQVAAGEAAISQAGNGKAVAAVDPDKLKTFLPDTVGGLPRTEVSSARAGAAGVSGSNAEAVYSKDNARITLTVTDLSAMGALAGMASAMGVESDKETATGYEKVGKVGGRMTTEEWDRSNNSGKYGVLIADRFMVQAEGSGTTIDALKSAVAAVGPDRLEGLARG